MYENNAQIGYSPHLVLPNGISFATVNQRRECVGTNSVIHVFIFIYRTQVYGRNTIEIDVKSYWELFRTEILNPFYLFQIFSVTLWCFDDYYYYAGCVFILSGISIYCSLHETRAVI